MTYNPFQIFLAKKFCQTNTEKIDDEVIEEWNSLSDEKRLKYIRKAEQNYDECVKEEKKQPFHSYLSDRELELLIKSYDFPEKPPPNSRYYYIQKYKSLNINEDDEQSANKASEIWKNLTLIEKNKILDEFYQLWESYELNYCNFLRNLPERRVDDLKAFLKLKKKLQKVSKNSLNCKTQINQEPVSKIKKIKKRSFRLFEPFEKFVQANRNDYQGESQILRISRKERTFLRSQYNSLSNDKKLRYIKEAEQEYDSFDFERNREKPMFASFLSKNEIKILFDSYDLPEPVPYNLASYFMKKMYKSGTRDVKVVFKRFREQTAKERQTLSQQHTRELEHYLAQNRLFLERLPRERQADYNFIKNGKNTMSKFLDDTSNSKTTRN